MPVTTRQTEGMGKRIHYSVDKGGAKCPCCLWDKPKKSRRSERRRRKQTDNQQ